MAFKIIQPTLNPDTIGRFAVTPGTPDSVITFPNESGEVATTSDIPLTASYAVTASYALTSPGGGLTGFVASTNITAPNNTINASRLLVSAASVDADLVIQPKGQGALTARLADDTYVGGNKRGTKAVDLQMELYDATDVASGEYAVLSGGTGNRSTGYASVCTGGDYNWVDGQWGLVTCGYINRVYAGKSTILNGRQNTIAASGQFGTVEDSAILAGSYSNITAANSVSLSTSNKIHGQECAVIGGYGNTITGSANGVTIINGVNSVVRRPNVTVINSNEGPRCIGSVVYGNKYYSGVWEEVVRPVIITSNSTPKEMTLDSTDPRDDDFFPGEYYYYNNRIVIPTDTTYVFEGIIVARRQDADNESAGYKLTGIIDNNAGTVALVGTPTVTVIHEDTAAWNVTVSADDTNNCLVITVTGENGKTIKWAGTIHLHAVTG